MLLSAALFALFMTGFWLYCLTDAILTPAPEFRGLTKSAWIATITVTFVGGALAWLIVRRRPTCNSSRSLAPVPRWDPDGLDDGYYSRGQRWTAADDAESRHPAGRAAIADARAAPKGPDDDQGFLQELDRAIHGDAQADEDT